MDASGGSISEKMKLLALSSSQQVDHWEEHDPDQIDHVPELCACFDIARVVAPRGKQQYANPDEDMRSVKAGQQVIKHEKRVGLKRDALHGLVGLFRAFDDQKQDAKARCTDQGQTRGTSLRCLSPSQCLCCEIA